MEARRIPPPSSLARTAEPAISRHPRVLKEVGLVREHREGRRRRYALNRARLRETLGGWVAAFDRIRDRDYHIHHEVENLERALETLGAYVGERVRAG